MFNKYKFLYLSLLLIVCAFFVGYGFAIRSLYMENTIENTYVDITTSTRNITIKNAPNNVFFRINGDLIQTGSIDLK